MTPVNCGFDKSNPYNYVHFFMSFYIESHDNMAGYYFDVLETVSNPTWVFKGEEKELWAARQISKKKALLVIYKELKEKNNGFVITAFFTTKIQKLLRREIIWQQVQQ